MAVKTASDELTFAELAKRLKENGDLRMVAEVINETNEIAIDMPFVAASDGDVDLATYAEVEEEGETVHAGEGVSSSSHTTHRVTNYTSLIKKFAQVSNDVLRKAGSRRSQVLQKETNLTLKGMGILMARLFVHGDYGVNDTEFNGMAVRRSALGETCIDAGGTGDALTSIYLCALGEGYVQGIYPSTSSSYGVEIDHQENCDIVKTVNGVEKHDRGDQTMFVQQYGLKVEEPKSLVRIANIPSSISGDDLIRLIFKSQGILPQGAPTYALYGNKSVMDIIDWANTNRTQVVRQAEDPWGKEIFTLRGYRCRRVDQITSTESKIS